MRHQNGRFNVANDNQLSYDPETRTLAAGETRELVTWCDWIEFLSVTTDTMWVSLNGSFFFPLSLGLILRPAGGIRRLFIRNTSGSANTVIISKGLGAVEDRRVVISPTTKLKVDSEPTPYGNLASPARVVGAPYTGAVTIVAAGSNLNGILISSAWICCLSDPTANAFFYDAGVGQYLLYATDSQTISLGGDVTFPAGRSLQYGVTGGAIMGIIYRIL